MANQNHEMVKNALDVVSVIAAIGSFLQVLTPFFGFVGCAWTLMRIAEMVTGKPFHEIIKRKRSEQSEQEKL